MGSWDIDVIGIAQTNLRETTITENEDYIMISKGRSKFEKIGGGVGLLVKKDSRFVIEELDIDSEETVAEDIAIFKLEYKVNKKYEKIIMVVCYMTVQGEKANHDNKKKYLVLTKISEKYKEDKLIIMGDMNGHTGILGEQINQNGQKLIDFAESKDLEILNHTYKGRGEG